MCLIGSLQRLSADRQIALESASRSKPAEKNLGWESLQTPQTTLLKSWEISLVVVSRVAATGVTVNRGNDRI